jgi:hypothetical protein
MERVVQIDTNIDYFENSVSSVLFQTKPGCSKTNFEFTEDYYKLTKRQDCFIASDFNEYENTIKTYFEMDFFNTITPEYFDENILFVIVLSANDGGYYKNGRFQKGDNNNFIYNIELWDNGKPVLFRSKCVYSVILIINMKKK